MYMKIYGPPEEVFDSWPEVRKAAVRGNFEQLPIRAGVLNHAEYDSLQRTDMLKLTKSAKRGSKVTLDVEDSSGAPIPARV